MFYKKRFVCTAASGETATNMVEVNVRKLTKYNLIEDVSV
jgi:hypothetical protein